MDIKVLLPIVLIPNEFKFDNTTKLFIFAVEDTFKFDNNETSLIKTVLPLTTKLLDKSKVAIN
ncbi:MAG: hypothetical protein EBS06_07030 [Proteobacteria bacterium]|nr:hypothetical protein [Pseudomonadota bacterium]